MEVILNSDIARLILGYLRDQSLEKASLAFCRTSPYLKEEYHVLKKGYKPVSLGPEKLVNIIREYCRINSQVLQFIETLSSEDKDDFLQQPSLEGKILILLKKSKYKSTEVVTRKTEIRPKRHYSSSDSDGNSKEYSSGKHILAKRRRLSGVFILLNNKKENISYNSRECSSTSENSLSNSEIHETDVNVGSNNINEIAEVPDFNDISEAILNNSTFQNKLVYAINSVLQTTDTNTNNEADSAQICNDEAATAQFGKELDDIIKTVMNSTEKDPVFEEILQEVVYSKNSGEPKASKDDLCTPEKSKADFLQNNTCLRLSAKKIITPFKIADLKNYSNYPRSTEILGNVLSRVNENNLCDNSSQALILGENNLGIIGQSATEVNSIPQTQLQDECSEVNLTETNQINYERITSSEINVNAVVETDSNLAVNSDMNLLSIHPGVSLENVIINTNGNSQTVLTSTLDEPTSLFCHNGNNNTYELPVFSESQLPTGQYMYTPIEKPVSIDPRTGEIAHISILRCAEKNFTSIEFIPNVPSNISTCIENENIPEKTVQIISDEIIKAVPEVEELENNEKNENALQTESETNNLVHKLEPTPPITQVQCLSNKEVVQSNTTSKKSHVRTLDFTTPPKLLHQKCKSPDFESTVQNLGVKNSIKNVNSYSEDGNNCVPVCNQNITTESIADVCKVAKVVTKEQVSTSNKNKGIKITDTPKSSLQSKMRIPQTMHIKKSSFENATSKNAQISKITKDVKSNRPNAKKNLRKPTPVCDIPTTVPLHKSTEQSDEKSKATILLSKQSDVPSSLPQISLENGRHNEKNEVAARVHTDSETEVITILEIKSQEDNEKSSKIKNSEIELKKWQEMRSIPRGQIDQQLRKAYSELEEKAKLKSITPEKPKRKKLKKKENKKEMDIEQVPLAKRITRNTTKKKSIESKKQLKVLENGNGDIEISEKKQENCDTVNVKPCSNGSIAEPPEGTRKKSTNEISSKQVYTDTEEIKEACENLKLSEQLTAGENLNLSKESQASIIEDNISKESQLETDAKNDKQLQCQDLSVDQQQLSDTLICQALLSLETPFKFDSSNFPKTPGIPTPRSHVTPAIKNMTFTDHFSILKNPDVPTPLIAITPGKGLTPNDRSEGSGHCGGRPTDYSSSSSYYRPDESDDLDRNFEAVLNAERTKRKSESLIPNCPTPDEKSTNKDNNSKSDDWSESIDTVQTVIKAKKYETKIVNKLNEDVNDANISLSPCKLEERLSRSRKSTSKSLNSSVSSSSRSSSSSSTNTEASTSTTSWSDVESQDIEEQQLNKNVKSNIPGSSDGCSRYHFRNLQTNKNEHLSPHKEASVSKTSLIVKSASLVNKRTAITSDAMALQIESLEEKRKRVMNKLKTDTSSEIVKDQKKSKTPAKRKVSPQKGRATIDTHFGKNTKPVRVIGPKNETASVGIKNYRIPKKVKPSILKTPKPQTYSIRRQKFEKECESKNNIDDSETNVATHPELAAREITASNMNTQLAKSKEIILSTKKSDDLLSYSRLVSYELIAKDLELTPSKGDITSESDESKIDKTKLSLSHERVIESGDGCNGKSNIASSSPIVKETNEIITEESINNEDFDEPQAQLESDEEEFEDPYDACQSVTIGEDDKMRHFRVVYKGKREPTVRNEQVGISDTIMNIFIEGVPHKLTVGKEIELFAMNPTKKTKQRRKAIQPTKIIVEQVEELTTHVLHSTSTPIKPKIKLVHKNKFNKFDNCKTPCKKQQNNDKKHDDPRKTTINPSATTNIIQDGQTKILPLSEENLQKVLAQSKLEVQPEIKHEDIDAVLSHLYGS